MIEIHPAGTILLSFIDGQPYFLYMIEPIIRRVDCVRSDLAIYDSVGPLYLSSATWSKSEYIQDAIFIRGAI